MSLVLSSLGLLYVALGVLAAMLVPRALVAARSWRRAELALPLGAATFLAIWFAAVGALATAGAFRTAVSGVPTIADADYTGNQPDAQRKAGSPAAWSTTSGPVSE
jgi:hypothetical protein